MSRKSLGILLVMAFSGCSAARTTFLCVDTNGNFVGSPNHSVQGVPAVVKVPTHMEVEITQTDYWKMVTAEDSRRQLAHLPEATSRSVVTREVTTNKLIMIDPKRPLSGEGQFAIQYGGNGEGAIQSVNYKAVDETLKNSAALAAAALRAFGTSTTRAHETGIGSKNNKLVKVERVIAVQRFPIDACQPSEVEAYVNQYINDCTPFDCHSPTRYATQNH